MASECIHIFGLTKRKGTARLCCWAGALLLSICAGANVNAATSNEGDRCESPGDVLKKTLKISAGGPYVAKAGEPIMLHGTYLVEGQSEDSDKLKQIGQALQSYLQDHGTYPPGALLNAHGQPGLSWRVLLLPYLGEQSLYKRFDLTKSWDSPANLRLLDEMPAVYRKSGAGCNMTETGFAGVDGVNSLFENTSAKLNGGHPLNGISQTEKIAAGVVGDAVHLPWTAPGDIDIAKVTTLGSQFGFSGEGAAFTPLLFLDGLVHFMPNNVGTGSMITWTHISASNGLCPCAPPTSVDAGIRAMWDLGKAGTGNSGGWEVRFLASQPGRYTVTLRVFDHFGNEYNASTNVEVR